MSSKILIKQMRNDKDVTGNHISVNEIKEYIRWWNVIFPIDRWWREKYRIPFGSKKHLESSFVDMLLEYYEDLEYRRIRLESVNEEENGEVDKYVAGSGSIFKSGMGVLSREEADKIYQNINLENITEK